MTSEEDVTQPCSAPSDKVDETSAENFEELGVCEELCAVLKEVGWRKPTQIQAAALPYALAGRDVIGLAETGSGKTGAFVIPVLQALLDNPQRMFALTLAPARELCAQIAEQFQALGSTISLEVCLILGGLDLVSQALSLAKRPHVIVASPGRLVDHLENTKGFNLKTMKYLVMDEADRLLSLDFDGSLEKIMKELPHERSTYMYSATMTTKVQKLQKASLRKPVKIEVNTKYDTAKGLIQHFVLVPHKNKMTHLVALASHFANYSAMVFANKCLTAQKTALVLRHLGFKAVSLHGKMTQHQRLGALTQFKSGMKKILVATEVGSRGLDIPLVDLVVNFDVPLSPKDYIHRVGRTARAMKTGRALTIITQYDMEGYQKIEHALGKTLDEFTAVTEHSAMEHHERTIEACRAAEIHIRDLEQKKAHSQAKGMKKTGTRPSLSVMPKGAKRHKK
eukprot:Selendium_serpulae@DN2529_c0_g1_i1.p1